MQVTPKNATPVGQLALGEWKIPLRSILQFLFNTLCNFVEQILNFIWGIQ